MKRFFILFLSLILCIGAFAADSLTVFYRIRLDQNIDPAARRLVTLGLEKAAAADAALAASIFHFGEITVGDLKQELKRLNIDVRC